MKMISLRKAMRECMQMPGMSVLAHGVMVARYFEDLQQHVLHGAALKYEWVLPEWAHSPTLWERLLPFKTVRRYQIYHDCGKPFCHEVDEDGRSHFPGHAQKSAAIWQALGQCEHEVELMARDMDAHLLKAEGVETFCQTPYAATLLLTALAELHANAAMFGGVESVSFKIKFKNLSRRGKAIETYLSQNSTHKEKRYA